MFLHMISTYFAYSRGVRITGRDAQVIPSIEQAIPRVVFSTLAKKTIRKPHFEELKLFQQDNPEYKFVVLDNDEQHDYVSSKLRGEKIMDIYERSKFGTMRSDILRVALMLFEGGIYIDGTKRLKIPLKQTIPTDAKFVFAHERNEIPTHFDINTDPELLEDDRKLIVCWCMMSSPNNQVFETMIESIERDSLKYEKKVIENPAKAILELTATYQYTRAVWKHLMNGTIDWNYAGVDFGEDEYVLIQQSYSRNPFRPHYTSAKNKRILV